MDKLILFDVDGTLVNTRSGATFRKSADDWQWLPGRLEKLRELKVQGVRMAVCTNQGGMAYGFMQQADILAELTRMCKEADIPIGGLYICYTHPKAKLSQYRMEDYRRKPGSGMLLVFLLMKLGPTGPHFDYQNGTQVILLLTEKGTTCS